MSSIEDPILNSTFILHTGKAIPSSGTDQKGALLFSVWNPCISETEVGLLYVPNWLPSHLEAHGKKDGACPDLTASGTVTRCSALETLKKSMDERAKSSGDSFWTDTQRSVLSCIPGAGEGNDYFASTAGDEASRYTVENLYAVEDYHPDGEGQTLRFAYKGQGSADKLSRSK